LWTFCLCPRRGNRGHTRAATASEDTRKEEPVADKRGAASDCGRDAAAGSLSVESGTPTRRECQPGVPLAKLYHEGRLGTTTNFLPVKMANEPALEATKEDDRIPHSGTLEIKLCKGTLRIFGRVECTSCLRARAYCRTYRRRTGASRGSHRAPNARTGNEIHDLTQKACVLSFACQGCEHRSSTGLQSFLDGVT
jgi:hypothetical protein